MTPPCLDGVRVLDLTRVLAGPYCTALLGDLGAEIIKVETPGGDDYRHVPPFDEETGGLFLLLNRGKKSISLDLRSETGRRIVRRLASSCDVVVENFRPGVMEQMGLGYAELSHANQRLIYVSISGFGQTGPMGSLPAYDLIIQAMTGFMDVSGEPDGPPMMTGETVADLTTGLFASWSVLAALLSRERSGKGQFVDVAMYDCLFNFLPAALTQHLYGETPPMRVGNRHQLGAPFGVFAAADGYFTIAVLNPKQFAKLTRAMDRPELAGDPRFSDNCVRNDNHAPLKVCIEAWSGSLSVAEVVATLQHHDVPCSPILSVAEAGESAQVRERSLLRVTSTADGRPISVMAQPVKFSGMPATSQLAPPALGADGHSILADLLDMAPDEIAGLVHQGVLHGA
ncbi:CoA transferase [Mesorhizobium sp. SP-1A]|uniref:CaiB/BaiF CoA transferase family protein n=1 Tax=Mesorhizobium sp. SP-1A TaxID=3077840 RepID=UPI0028F74B03|nr:CoA transferase [Mesorhizobium sp. SP-1A]